MLNGVRLVAQSGVMRVGDVEIHLLALKKRRSKWALVSGITLLIERLKNTIFLAWTSWF